MFMMQVLSKLLPIVIKQLQSAHPQTHKKVCITPAATGCCSTNAGTKHHTSLQVLELLSHVNKRIKGQMSIKLPLGDLLDM